VGANKSKPVELGIHPIEVTANLVVQRVEKRPKRNTFVELTPRILIRWDSLVMHVMYEEVASYRNGQQAEWHV
jgi:hypothetical protein